jgi:ComF family protein
MDLMRRLNTLQFGPMIARLRPMAELRKFSRGLLDLALPPRCLRCDDDLISPGDISLCLKCIQLIAPELPDGCRRCGAVLPDGFEVSDRCPSCEGYVLKFDAVYPLGRYDGALKEVVLKTKRLSSEALSLTVGRLLATRLRDKIVQFAPQAVVPIPMHWARRLKRGVNSPELLAECLGKTLGIPVLRTLRRRRYTSPQKDLLPKERFRNVRGAFGMRQLYASRLRGARVLLVDDILTTGATCSEAAKLLKQAGAAAVAVAVVARAEGMSRPTKRKARTPEFIHINKPR